MEVSVRLCCPCCRSRITIADGRTACAACGTTYVVSDGIPNLTPNASGADETKVFFDRVASQLDDSKLGYVPFEDSRRDTQLRILSRACVSALDRWVPKGSLVLDVGCGHGALFEDVVSRYRMIGVDSAIEMLPLARKRGYAVYGGDAVALPFEADQYDAVICTEVLQHFPDQEPVMAELARVCRPGGAVIVSTLNKLSLARLAWRTLAAMRGQEALPLPILRRAATSVTSAAASFGLAFSEAAWVCSPSNIVLFQKNARSLVSPLATNFILRLEKPIRS